MADFNIYDAENAPEQSKSLLENSKTSFGFIPGLHGVMAEAPGLLEGYQVLHKLFSESSFNADEKTVVWQCINVEHDCHYCVPAHTGIAKSMKVDDAITDALRNETPLPSKKLESLRDFTLKLVRSRGKASEEDLKLFFEAGFDKRHGLEVILGISQKVMSNYTNSLAGTPVDSVFEKFEWHKATTA